MKFKKDQNAEYVYLFTRAVKLANPRGFELALTGFGLNGPGQKSPGLNGPGKLRT